MNRQQSAIIETLKSRVYLDPEVLCSEQQDIIASVQLGLGSRAGQPGPLMIDDAKSVLSEHAVVAIQQLWRDAMGVEYE